MCRVIILLISESDIMVNVLKFEHFSHSVLKMLVIRAGLREMIVRIANREDPE